jgi:hypothetical protein
MHNYIRAGSLVAVTIALSACKPAIAPSNAQESTTTSPVPAPSAPAMGLSPEEETSIEQGLIQLLSRFQDHNALGEFRVPCTNMYGLGIPKIVDSSLIGATGKVRIAVPITAAIPMSRPNVEPYFPTQYCYGAPPGGWTKGMVSTSIYVVNIEKWASGWRLSQQQTFGPS